MTKIEYFVEPVFNYREAKHTWFWVKSDEKTFDELMEMALSFGVLPNGIQQSKEWNFEEAVEYRIMFARYTTLPDGRVSFRTGAGKLKPFAEPYDELGY